MNWKEKTKLGVWSAIGGAILTMIIGFAWGGWVTGGTAGNMAEEKAEKAVVDRLAPICVEQFNHDPDKDQKLKELKEKGYYDKNEYMQKQGWAKMPGEKEPDRKVSEECARRLVDLEK